MRSYAVLLVTAVASILSVSTEAADLDWSKVDQAIGRKGTEQPGGIHEFSFPRSDLQVTVDGVSIKPALALGGMGCISADGVRCHVHGRYCFDGHGNQPRHEAVE